MVEQVLAAVRTAPEHDRVPRVPPSRDPARRRPVAPRGRRHLRDRREDVREPAVRPIPVIMGHENIGVIADAGPKFLSVTGSRGDRIFVEHYVACYRCAWCHAGEYRHCEATDWRTNPDAIATATRPRRTPQPVGRFRAVHVPAVERGRCTRCPGVSAELAGLVTPMSNGIEWALLDCGVGYDSTVLIQGPGQQGLSQVVACKQAGASRHRDRHDAGTRRGSSSQGARRRPPSMSSTRMPARAGHDLTGGEGVDVVLDCTAGAGTAPVLLGVDVLKRREGTLLIQGELATFPDFPSRSSPRRRSRSRARGATATARASSRSRSSRRAGSRSRS
jgi:threonine dehydrogenase-like Zn-dependent dehydrogenase